MWWSVELPVALVFGSTEWDKYFFWRPRPHRNVSNEWTSSRQKSRVLICPKKRLQYSRLSTIANSPLQFIHSCVPSERRIGKHLQLDNSLSSLDEGANWHMFLMICLISSLTGESDTFCLRALMYMLSFGVVMPSTFRKKDSWLGYWLATENLCGSSTLSPAQMQSDELHHIFALKL